VSNRRAFTLIELTITAVVLLVVTALGALLLARTLKVSTRGTLQAEMQQQAVTALNRLVTDMRKSSAAGISVRSGAAPKAIAICPLSSAELRPGQPPPVKEDGTLVWSSFFLIYHYDESRQQLRYREWPPGLVAATSEEESTVSPRRLSPARLAAVLGSPPPREEVVATGVVAFNVGYPPGSGGSDELYVQPLTLQIVQQRLGNTGGRDPERFTYTRTVFLPEQR
jgi:type II secretory pathway pseudopilin PulG